MRFCLIASLSAAFALAQNQPNAETEQALRERVAKFYTAFKDSKYKAAFAMVADDSQDAFLSIPKAAPKSFSLDKIEWFDGGKQAKVFVAIERDILVGGQVFPGRFKEESYWKQENGEWLWFQPPITEVHTPLGTFQKPLATGEAPPKIDFKDKMSQAPTEAQLTNAVTVKIPPVEFSRTKPGSVTLSLTNKMPGYVVAKLRLPELPGLSASTTLANVAAGETLTIEITWTPGAQPKPEDDFGLLEVQPLERRHQFKIVWKD